jgi:predicted GTPase
MVHLLWRATTHSNHPNLPPSSGHSFDISQCNVSEILNSNQLLKVNILIVGKTVAGKSTLINSIFNANLSKSCKGKSATQAIIEFSLPNIPITIYDTPGLELKDNSDKIRDFENFIREKNSDSNASKRIHVVWFCVNENGIRTESQEENLINILLKYVPVFCVITQSYSNDMEEVLRKEFPQISTFIPVVSQTKILGDNYSIHPFGLEKLVQSTLEILPSCVAASFVSAQQVNFKTKVRSTKSVVRSDICQVV